MILTGIPSICGESPAFFSCFTSDFCYNDSVIKSAYFKSEKETPMHLPKDPVMLLSMVNMKLRDQYASLDELCIDLEEDKEELCAKLSSAGFSYDEKTNQFR